MVSLLHLEIVCLVGGLKWWGYLGVFFLFSTCVIGVFWHFVGVIVSVWLNNYKMTLSYKIRMVNHNITAYPPIPNFTTLCNFNKLSNPGYLPKPVFVCIHDVLKSSH